MAPAVSGDLAQRLGYWRCILLTTGPGCVPARILGRASSQPTKVASCRHPALDADLHEYPGDLACTSFAGVDSRRQADLDVYLQARTGDLAQRLLALPSVDKRPQLCRASLCSAYWNCLLLTTGPSCVPARILGELAHRLPTLPPVDNRPWARTCMYIWAS